MNADISRGPSATVGAPGDPPASFRLDHRLIVVTGASQGIGRAFAECFARAGRRGDESILNGEKAFIANGNIGKLFFIDARTDKLARDAFSWNHPAGGAVQRLEVAGRLA